MVLMVSVMQTTVFRGIMTFVFTGILPLALLLFLVGTPQRRRNQLAKSQIDANQVAQQQTKSDMQADAAAQGNAERVGPNQSDSAPEIALGNASGPKQ